MQIDNILFILGISEIISLICIVFCWRSNHKLGYKIALSLIALIPLLGPVFFAFISHDVHPKSVFIKNRMPRGEMTHLWISFREILSGGKHKHRENESND